MPLISTRAVILQAFPYSDTSKILRFLSPDYGVRSVIAKGALRPKSRFGGVLEPFTEGQLHFVLKEGRDLHTLGAFDLIRSRQGIGRNLAAFAGASLIAELLLRFGTEESQPDLYDAVIPSLDACASGTTDPAGAALAGVWHVIALLGYEPQLEECVVCGRSLAAEEPTRFDVDAGGVACTGCRRQGRVVGPSARATLRELVRGEVGTGQDRDRSLHRALLRAFLTSHLVSDRPLRSLDLFVDELR